MASNVQQTGNVGVVPPNKQGVGALRVNVFNGVNGLKADPYLPARTPDSPTAIRLTVPKATAKVNKDSTFSVSLEGKNQNLTVKVPKDTKPNANVIALDLEKQLRALSPKFHVEVKLGNPTKAGDPAEIVIYKTGRTAQSPVYAAYEAFLKKNGGKFQNATPEKKIPDNVSPLDPYITISNTRRGIHRLTTTSDGTSYLTVSGAAQGPSMYFKLN